MGVGGLRGFGVGPFNPDRRLSNLLLGEPSNKLSAREQFLGGSTSESLRGLSIFPAPAPGLRPTPSVIQEGFATTLSRIELDPTRAQRASQHYNAIKDWLEKRLNVEVRQVGSFQRSTKTRPRVINGMPSAIDIDAVVCFGDATYTPTPGCGMTGTDALRGVQDALTSNQTYRILDPVIDHPVVTLSYGSEFSVELIPAFRNRLPPDNFDRNPPSYFIPNSMGGWQPADFDYDSEFITAANKSVDGKLIPAIKLMKQFVRNREIALKSFHVEIVCLKLILPFLLARKQDLRPWDWRDVLSVFLNCSPLILPHPLSISGSRSSVPPIDQLSNVITALTSWGALCNEFRKLDNVQSSLPLWRQFYGDPFPSN